jgi:hypothetical protein
MAQLFIQTSWTEARKTGDIISPWLNEMNSLTRLRREPPRPVALHEEIYSVAGC